MNKFEYVYKEVKGIYPELTEEEIGALIEKSLEQKSVQEVIANYICSIKERQ